MSRYDDSELGGDTGSFPIPAQVKIEEAREETDKLQKDIRKWQERHPFLHAISQFPGNHIKTTITTILATILGGGYMIMPQNNPNTEKVIDAQQIKNEIEHRVVEAELLARMKSAEERLDEMERRHTAELVRLQGLIIQGRPPPQPMQPPANTGARPW